MSNLLTKKQAIYSAGVNQHSTEALTQAGVVMHDSFQADSFTHL